MPTYVYETIPNTPATAAERFEIRQPFDEVALSVHPETGVPVRRVISGGLAVLPNGSPTSKAPQHGCGPATCQCGRFD
jgi:predicted nucleic acid-binding Zn ribbon protein